MRTRSEWLRVAAAMVVAATMAVVVWPENASAGAAAEQPARVPAIAAGQRPALVYVDGEGGTRQVLWVATFEAGDARRQRLLSANDCQVTQLSNAAFLVAANESARRGQVLAIDLARGTSKRIAETTRMRCLRSEPKRRRAMLATVNLSVPEVRLTELNLDTFAAKLRCTLPQAIVREIDSDLRVSPDFEHLAYAHRLFPRNVTHSHVATYALRVVDLATMHVTEVDPDVRVELSRFSSFSFGRPPFAWIDNRTILYQTILPRQDAMQVRAMHLLKTADTVAKKTAERLRDELLLPLSGGTLRWEPVTRRLLYRHEWRVSLKEARLVPKDQPFSAIWLADERRTRVLLADAIVHEGLGAPVSTCLSPSRRHFAFVLRRDKPAPRLTLLALLHGARACVNVVEGEHTTLAPVGWVEAR